MFLTGGRRQLAVRADNPSPYVARTLQQAIAGLKSVSKVVVPLVKKGDAMEPERIAVLIFGGIP